MTFQSLTPIRPSLPTRQPAPHHRAYRCAAPRFRHSHLQWTPGLFDGPPTPSPFRGLWLCQGRVSGGGGHGDQPERGQRVPQLRWRRPCISLAGAAILTKAPPYSGDPGAPGRLGSYWPGESLEHPRVGSASGQRCYPRNTELGVAFPNQGSQLPGNRESKRLARTPNSYDKKRNRRENGEKPHRADTVVL